MANDRLDRRRFCGVAAASVAAGPLGLLGISKRLNAMTDVMPEMIEAETGPDDIRPFRVSFPDSDLAELRRRVDATRWPEKELVSDDTQGVQLVTMQNLARYWATQYDWRRVEEKLNSYPQFVTNIDSGVSVYNARRLPAVPSGSSSST